MKKYRTKSGKVEEKLPGINATVSPSEKVQIAMAGGANTLGDVQTILGQQGKRNNLKGQGAKHFVSFDHGEDKDDSSFSPDPETGGFGGYGGGGLGPTSEYDPAEGGYTDFSGNFVSDQDQVARPAPSGSPLYRSNKSRDETKDILRDASKESAASALSAQNRETAFRGARAMGLKIGQQQQPISYEDLEVGLDDTWGPFERGRDDWLDPDKPFTAGEARETAKRALLAGEKPGTDWNKAITIGGVIQGAIELGLGISSGGGTIIASLFGGAVREDIKSRKTTTSFTPYENGKRGKRVDTTYESRAKNRPPSPPTPPDESGDDTPKKKKKLIRFAANGTNLAVAEPDEGPRLNQRERERYRAGWRFA